MTHSTPPGQGGALIAVFVLADIESQLLDRLHSACTKDNALQLRIITSPPTSSEERCTQPSASEDGIIRSQFTHKQDEADIKSVRKEDETLSSQAWIVVDAGTAQTGSVCVYLNLESDRTRARTDFDSIAGIISDFMYHGVSARDFVSGAQITGGIYRRKALDTVLQEAATSPVHLDRFEPHPDFFACYYLFDPDTGLPYYPVFCTAHIPVQVLNDFALAAHRDRDLDNDEPEERRPAVAFVQSLDPEECPRFWGPMTAAPSTPAEIRHALPAVIDRIVRARFTNSRLNHSQYFILDKFTEDTRSVIIVDNSHDGLQISRNGFDTALTSLFACGITSLQVDTIAYSGASNATGIAP